MTDAAALLDAIDTASVDYVAGLRTDALDGVTVGILNADIAANADNTPLLQAASATLVALGARLRPATLVDTPAWGTNETFMIFLSAGIRYDMMPYVAARSGTVKSVDDLIAYNAAAPIRRIPFGQLVLQQLAPLSAGLSPADYTALAARLRQAATAILDDAFRRTGADVLVSFENIHSKHYATAGYPAITVPLGVRAKEACWNRSACRPSACRRASRSSASRARTRNFSRTRSRSNRRRTFACSRSCGRRFSKSTGSLMSFLKRAFAVVAALLAAVSFATPATAQQGVLGKYSTKAALMSVGENPEAPTAELFYTAYTLDGADPARRPITFCFNGGPGASSVYLHMAVLGPMTLDVHPDGSLPSVPAKLVPNPHTWLYFTDLVFIDPVQTGYSRALPGANGAPGDPAPWFEAEADLRSIAQFIRRYLTQNSRWLSPKAIAGESYGGLRVAALSRMLMEEYDINLNRAVLISPLLKTTLPPEARATTS